jgi:hypothetical protein
MAASLLVRVRRDVPFFAVLEHTSAMLSQIMNLETVPKLVYELPRAKEGLSLENQMIDINFPAVYIRFDGIDRSLVNFHAFNSPVPGDSARLLLACEASGRGPVSEVLAAALASSASSLANGSIDDGGHHWLDKDEYSPEELIEGLRLSERPQDFHSAVELVYRRLAIHERYPAR